MLWLDLALGVLLLLSILVGVLRGFIREVFSLGSLLLAGWIAVTFSADFASYLARWIADEFLQQVAAGVGLFVVSAFTLGLVSTFLVYLLKKVGLAGMDRTLGGIFGLIRGVALAVIAVWIIGKTFYTDEPWWQESIARGPMAPAVQWLDQWVQSFSSQKNEA